MKKIEFFSWMRVEQDKKDAQAFSPMRPIAMLLDYCILFSFTVSMATRVPSIYLNWH